MSPTSSPSRSTRIRPVSVTRPIAAPPTSQRSHVSSTASSFAGSTTHSIRSCDSLTIISNGSMPGSRSGTLATSMSIPTPPLEAISDAEEVSPAAPRSCSETISPRSSSSSEHSSSLLLLEGVADLHGRALGGVAVLACVELGGGEHRGAADAVAAGRGTEQDDQVPGPRRGAADQPLALGRARAPSR